MNIFSLIFSPAGPWAVAKLISVGVCMVVGFFTAEKEDESTSLVSGTLDLVTRIRVVSMVVASATTTIASAASVLVELLTPGAGHVLTMLVHVHVLWVLLLLLLLLLLRLRLHLRCVEKAVGHSLRCHHGQGGQLGQHGLLLTAVQGVISRGVSTLPIVVVVVIILRRHRRCSGRGCR